jgi:pyruvate dehydrogenase E1 component alpha subunit
MRAYLEGRGASAQFFADVDAEGEDVAADLRTRIVTLAEPAPADMFAHVYSEPHPLMTEQRSWLADYEASFEEGTA